MPVDGRKRAKLVDYRLILTGEGIFAIEPGF